MGETQGKGLTQWENKRKMSQMAVMMNMVMIAELMTVKLSDPINKK